MKDDEIISAWTERLLEEASALPPQQARDFVRDLYFAAQRALDVVQSEVDAERDE